MKRRITYLLTAGLCLSALAGCNTNNASNVSTSLESNTKNAADANVETNVHDAADDIAAETEEATEEDTEAEKEAERQAELQLTNIMAKKAYADTVYGYICRSWDVIGAPAIQNGINQSGYPEHNTYELADINNDGVLELIVSINDVSMADARSDIYTYDAASHKAVRMDMYLAPTVKFYDSGVLVDEVYSTASDASKILLCDLYKYDASTGTYVKDGSTYWWDKSIAATENNGKPFPDDIDKDGNGQVFMVETTDQSYTVMDNEDYNAWLSNYTGQEITAEKKEFSQTMTDELCADYETWFLDAISELEADGNIDLAVNYAKFLYRNEKVNTDAVITYELEDADMETYTGYVNGQACIERMDMDGGEQRYTTAVDGITVMGIKPGESLADAKAKLEKYGLYEQEENVYVNGVGVNSIGIYIHSDDGATVSSITATWFSYYYS